MILLFLLGAVPVRAATLQIVPAAYSSGKPYLSCYVDGAKARFFLDTGSAMTLVASSTRFAAYTNLGSFQFKSASGIAQETETIRVASLQIDDIQFSDLKIGRATFHGAENTLGIDIIGRQPFALRFKNKSELRLKAARPRLALTTLTVSSHGLVSIPLRFGEADGHALWDTGVSVTSVDQQFIAEHPENFKATKDYVRGTDGAGKTMLLQIYRARKISIAERTFEDVRVVAVDLSVLRENGQNVQAVLGFNVIRKANWFFDPKNRLWKCER